MAFKSSVGKRVFFLGLVALLGFSSAGCGSNDPIVYPPYVPNPVPTIPIPPVYPYPYYPSCPAGQIWIWGFCYAQPTFQDACVWGGGTYIAASGNQPALCKSERVIPPSTIVAATSAGGFPRLNPSHPEGPRAFETTIWVNSGDRLSFKGSGRWNDDSSDVGCDNNPVNLDGMQGTTQLTLENLPQGWVGSDGTQVFFIGSNTASNPISMTHDGLLRVGFNAPSATDYCYKLTIETFKVTHCEDASGTTHPCP